MVSNEVTVNNLRVDTLAFDKETGSLVVIEYKNMKSFSVVDQGIAYLSNMLNNKAEFILEYNENKQKTLTRTDVDWSQSRVVFVSPYYSTYQREAINFKDLPIELWQIKKLENNLIFVNQVNIANPTESFKKISPRDKRVDAVKKEIKVYTENHHLENKPDQIKELYQQIKDYALSLDDAINIKATKVYVSFRYNKRIIFDLTPFMSKIKMWLNRSAGTLKDDKGVFRDVSETGHWGNGDYEAVVEDDKNIEYIFSHIKETYRIMEGTND